MRLSFPTNRVVRMRYATFFNLDPGLGSGFASKIFRANGLFDPDFSLGGHQPFGFNQWSVFYKRYIVLGSRISIMGISNQTTPSTPCIYGVRTVADTTHFAITCENLMEDPKVSWRYVQGVANGNVPKPARANFSAKKWWNVADVKDNAANLGALITADPTSQTYFHCFYGGHDIGATDLPVMHFLARIEYIVMWQDPDELEGSS